MLKNRLLKNLKKLKKYLKKEEIEAYRLYDRDMPEFPYIIDVLKDYALVYERGKKDIELDKQQETQQTIRDSLVELEFAPEKIIFKTRERQKGKQQYDKLDHSKNFFSVREGDLLYWVNPFDYLDYGLFLDHRPLRKMIQQESAGKAVLNLFAYTGSISVAAAKGGAEVTTIDMSNTYLAWAQRNFELNNLISQKHAFIRADIVQWLQRPNSKKFDLIILDPPTFSNSKKMEQSFDIQRDQEHLIKACMQKLKPEGKLYFSNNKKDFKLSEQLSSQFKVHNISAQTIPLDFRDGKIHHCFAISFA